MERSIKLIQPVKLAGQKFLRVAAYARVSVDKDTMKHSLAAQVSYYSSYIQQHGDWEFAGIYADEAYSGTKDNRPRFVQMLKDCRDGKIDRIITKSISRFARNTLTLLKTIRELRSLGIGVYFEEQNIDTLTEAGELMITLLASQAQEESLATSENCKWRIRKMFEEGYTTSFNMVGYRVENGLVVLVPEEAKIVRRVFDLYLAGYGKQAIANILREEGVPSRTGGEWNTNVLSMNLTGYEVPPSAYFIGRDTPTITISKKRIAFSKGCFDKLKQSLYVEILYHPILQAIVIRTCDDDAVNAICTISPKNGKRIMSIRAPAFSAAIYEKMNWMPDYDFRFKGVCRERGSECALIFYLDEPKILVGKKEADLAEEHGVNKAGSCFIPARRRTVVAYPEEWEKHPIGISYELRKQRDRLIDNLSSTDIREPSAVVMNPFIGEIPSRQEILEEVGQLLISM